MSDYVPLEIQSEIIKTLPVKLLLQFRSVSKTWKSLIDSPAFIACYSGQQHLLAYHNSENKYDSIVDDDTFPHQKVSVTLPVSDQQKDYMIIGCSHGLLCLYDEFGFTGTGKAVIWNISIRKAVTVVVRNVGFGTRRTFGFGVCRETSDPKIVKIILNGSESVTNIHWQVEVFSLSTGDWRPPYGNLPRQSIHFHYASNSVVSINGVLYWFAYDYDYDRINMDGEFRSNKFVISFDLTSEEFREVKLPDSIPQKSHSSLSMFNLRESLVVHAFDVASSVVWILEDGVTKSFGKLYTINLPNCVIVRGFRKSGEPIYETVKDEQEIGGILAVYEPNSKSMNSLGIDEAFSFSVFP